MLQYYMEPRSRKYAKGYGLLSLAKKYKKQLFDKRIVAFKKLFHKTGEF